jgi:hypothetical protein
VYDARMAKKTITTLIDDLDGTEADQSISFAFEGVNYSIDLSDKNADKFRSAIKPYLDSATRSGRGSGTRASSSTKTSKEELDAARTWLRKEGHEVSDRGRIKGELMELYRSQNN